jgi:poly-gamma-glutamate synthesis protein (capsule biosynthesis protein)
LRRARRPRIVRRLGLRVGFVGFSDILPLSFAATPTRAGTAFAAPAAVRRAVTRARRRADVVVATFHWGTERSTHPNARQRLFARIALRAGAHAVIGAHPHVLQPTRTRRRRVVAYSLGNFIWTPSSALTARTGILRLRLSGRGVEGARLRKATIVGGQPRLGR